MIFWLVRFVLRNASHVIFNSEQQLALYEKYFGLSEKKMSVIPNPVPRIDSNGIVRESPNDEIVFAGRFVVLKNITSLIRAFAKAKLPDSYRLLLIGGGPQKKNIEELADTLHVRERVEILPPLPQRELLKRIKDSRALVIPSWTDISPNQVFEAMQMKIPMLVTKENFLSIREQLPEMIDPTSDEDIARKLEMLADESRYPEFAARWGTLSFEYDWDREMSEHRNVFEKVLRG